jgi:predicted DNA-binding transcriptional regulator AlpA
MTSEGVREQINRFATFQHPGHMDTRTLISLLSDKSVSAVATSCGVTRYTIYRWCKKHNVP